MAPVPWTVFAVEQSCGAYKEAMVEVSRP